MRDYDGFLKSGRIRGRSRRYWYNDSFKK